MAGDASPYATLGLEPGADWKAIEKAYHKLIKRHHPDRAGGDAARAAEITRAYRELKRERSEGRALVLLDELEPVGPQRTWPRYAFLAAGAALLLVAIRGASLIETLSASEASGARVAQSTIPKDEPDPMDRPLALSAIDGAIADALRTARMKDEVALASASGDAIANSVFDPRWNSSIDAPRSTTRSSSFKIAIRSATRVLSANLL